MLSVSRLGWIDLRPVEDDPRPESIEVVEFLQPVLEDACEVLSVDTELETESCPGDSLPVGDAEERSVREPNIALKRLPADREDRRLSFFGGIFGGQTFTAPSLLRSES